MSEQSHSASEPSAAKRVSARQKRLGWVQAGLFVFAIAALNIVYGIAKDYGADIMIFTLYATSFAAIGMLIVSGISRDWRAIISAPASLIFGAATICMEGFYYALITTSSPTHASLLLRLAIPVSILIGIAAFAKRGSLSQLIGCLIIIACTLPVSLELAADQRLPAILLAVVCALVVSIKTFASEHHPWNMAARTVREKLQVTGLVVLGAATIGYAALTLFLGLQYAGAITPSPLLPTIQSVAHAPTVILALLLGAPVLLAMNYLTFSSVVRISTEKFLATSALTPLVTFVFQIGVQSIGVMSVTQLSWWLAALTFFGLVGVALTLRESST